MNLLEAARFGLKTVRNGVNWLWGWSLMGEALCLDRLINMVEEGSKLQNWLVVRSFRTAIAGANLLTGGMFEIARAEARSPDGQHD